MALGSSRHGGMSGIVTVSIITRDAAAFILRRVKQNSRESSVVFQEALGLTAAPIEASRKAATELGSAEHF